MATIAALPLCEAIIPLQTAIETDSLHMMKVEHSLTEGTNNRDQTTNMYLSVCDIPSKKELLF